MIIVNGVRHYAKEIKAAEVLPFDGWDKYNGRNYQWYTVRWNRETGLVIVDANNSGDCYGDYSTRYYNSPVEFAKSTYDPMEGGHRVNKLFGDVDEDNELAMAFIDELVKGGILK